MYVHTQQARRVVGWVLGMAVFASLALCYQGMNPRIGLSDVTGRVTYSGRPLSGGFICLSSENGNLSAMGELERDGSFRVLSGSARVGAAPGLYHLSLFSREGGTPIPAKFGDPRTSGLAIEVPAGWSDLNIDLH